MAVSKGQPFFYNENPLLSIQLWSFKLLDTKLLYHFEFYNHPIELLIKGQAKTVNLISAWTGQFASSLS